MNGTIIMQGAFTSTGVNTTINLPFNVAWMKVWNTSNIINQVNSSGYEFQFLTSEQGFPTGLTIILESNAGSTAVNETLSGASLIFPINTSISTPGAPVALTAISNASPPLVSTGSTVGLATNSGVVEIINTTGAQQLGGMSFSVGTVVANTSFTLKYMPAIAAATGGFYRIIPFDPIFYPVRRFITAITTGATTQIQMSVDSTMQVGQLVRIVVPSAYGSISQNINGLTATITAINAGTNTVTVNLNSTGFGTFVFPLTGAVPFTQAQLVPVGSGAPDAGETSNSLNDATVNQAMTGMVLIGGTALLPAGQNGDIIYWQAGSAFNLP